MTGKDLSLVYTNETVLVESSIQAMEQLLAEDKYQVVWSSTKKKHNSLVDLASAIIYPYYMKMKNESKKDKNTSHGAWDQRLDEEHIKYAAKELYTRYEMYRRIIDMRKYLRPAADEGSSHGEVSGASQEVDD
ncbi:putative ubiquitin-conjugating enzyme E2 26 [Hordeum vulgare]|nr:putative ubiquitin-conjugating enzyme E2 26 [Hordeum vulgare]